MTTEHNIGPTECGEQIPPLQRLPLTDPSLALTHPSDSQGDVYLGPNLVFDNEVVESRFIDGVDNKVGEIFTDVVWMRDGTPYIVRTGRPAEQKTDIGIVDGSALGTDIEGHNTYRMLKMMELGYVVVLISSEGDYHDKSASLLDRHRQASSIQLARSAHNTHKILDHTAKTGIGHRPDKIIMVGESKTAMEGMGVAATAPMHEREIIYADFIAPCFAERPRWLGLHPILHQIVPEIRSLEQVFADSTHHLNRVAHYARTLNLNPNFLYHQLWTWRALISGDAGELAKIIPKDRALNITAFRKDVSGQAEKWQEIFAGHDLANIDIEPGAHFAIGRERTLRKQLGRLARLQDQLGSDSSAAAIDFTKVHLQAA